MANELEALGTHGATVYALIFDASGNVWQTTSSTFVTYVGANQANYAVTMTESVSASGYFVGSFPTAVTAAGTYGVVAYQQAGGSPASSDITVGEGEIVWDGSAEVLPGALSDGLTALTYVKTYMQITTNTDDSLLRSLITASSEAIQNYTGKPFVSTTYTEDYEGVDDWKLQLRQVPVQSVTSVIFDAYQTNPTTVTGSNFILDKGTGQITLKPTVSTLASGWFYSGPTVRHQVTYVAGFSAVPANVQQACAQIVQGLYAMRGQGLLTDQEQIGDYHGWYTLAEQFITGNGDLRAKLDYYKDWTVG